MSVVPSTTMSIPFRPPGCYTLQGQWRFHIISTGFPAGRRNLGLRVPSGRISRPSIELEPLPLPPSGHLGLAQKQSEAGIKDFERVSLLSPVAPIDILPSLINFAVGGTGCCCWMGPVSWTIAPTQGSVSWTIGPTKPNQGSNSVSLQLKILQHFHSGNFQSNNCVLPRIKFWFWTNTFCNLFIHIYLSIWTNTWMGPWVQWMGGDDEDDGGDLRWWWWCWWSEVMHRMISKEGHWWSAMHL